MADSKITALASIGTGTDPANDPLVIVDVSDVSPGGMSATGTTKKVTLNNLLACSPTATLASATITGDLTVKTNVLKVDTTNNRVGIGTASPGSALDVYGETRVRSGNQLRVYRADNAIYSSIEDAGSGVGLSLNNANGDGFLLKVTSNNVYQVSSSYVQTWYDGAGGTRMTLNATGLGVGVASPAFKLDVAGSAGSGIRFTGNSVQNVIGETGGNGLVGTVSNHNLGLYTNATLRALIDTSGNVGIGVTPSAWHSSAKAFEIGTAGNSVFSSAATFVEMTNNAYLDSVSNWVRVNTGNAAARFRTSGSGFLWLQAAAGANPITWTTAMQLDASGNLILQSSATPATLTTNGQLTVNATSNTNLRFSYRGSDGTTRTANITLA